MRRQIGLLAAILFLISACQSAPPEIGETPTTPVTVVIPKVQDVPVYVESVGFLEPSYSVEIRPEITGTIEKIFVQEGSWVESEAPLFQFDGASLEIKVKEAKAQLLMDQAAYDTSKKTLERFYALAQKDLVSRVEWDAMELQVAQGAATVAMDEARVESALLDAEGAIIKAPGAGRIGRIDVHVGSSASVGQPAPLTNLTRSDPLIVNFSITEKELVRLPRGTLPIEVHMLCTKGCVGEGTITYVDSRFDSKSGLLFVRGELPNPENRFFPGQSVHLKIPVSVQKQATLIPQRAVKYNQQGPYAYVVTPENTVEFRQLTLSEEVGDDVVVLEGLLAQEPVITSSHTRLSPGLKVEMQK